MNWCCLSAYFSNIGQILNYSPSYSLSLLFIKALLPGILEVIYIGSGLSSPAESNDDLVLQYLQPTSPYYLALLFLTKSKYSV